jgi:hypothetical protein
MRLVAGTVFSVVALAAPASAANPWLPLLRPLHLPRLAAGARCPVSRVEPGVQFSRRYGVGRGLGGGPVFPVGLASGVLRFAPPANFGSHSWGGQKVLWFVLPSYRGPVLIRGGRLDGKGLVRFENGNIPPSQIRITTGTAVPGGVTPPAGARYLPSYTRLNRPGCYAYQIDGTTFSHIVVFRAAPQQ